MFQLRSIYIRFLKIARARCERKRIVHSVLREIVTVTANNNTKAEPSFRANHENQRRE